MCTYKHTRVRTHTHARTHIHTPHMHSLLGRDRTMERGEGCPFVPLPWPWELKFTQRASQRGRLAPRREDKWGEERREEGRPQSWKCLVGGPGKQDGGSSHSHRGLWRAWGEGKQGRDGWDSHA